MKHLHAKLNQADGTWSCQVSNSLVENNEFHSHYNSVLRMQRDADIIISEDGVIFKHRYHAYDRFTRLKWDSIAPHVTTSPRNIVFVSDPTHPCIKDTRGCIIFSNRSVVHT